MESIIKKSIENYRKYGVSDKAIEAAVKAEEALADVYARIESSQIRTWDPLPATATMTQAGRR